MNHSVLPPHRCVIKKDCKKNDITVRSELTIDDLASEALCPPQVIGASRVPGYCCHEANIIHDCSESEFVQDGYKCVENGKCYDKATGKKNFGVKINDVLIKAEKARCPLENQICCKKTDPIIDQIAEFDKCEDHEGTV